MVLLGPQGKDIKTILKFMRMSSIYDYYRMALIRAQCLNKKWPCFVCSISEIIPISKQFQLQNDDTLAVSISNDGILSHA